MDALLQAIIDYDNSVLEGLQRFGGNEQLFMSCLQKYWQDKNLDELRNNIDTLKYAEAAQNAHALKGITANLGLARQSKLAASLLQQLKTSNYDQIERECQDFFQEYEKYSTLLNKK